MKNMFVNVFVKDYELELDGKVVTISGERWLGVLHPENEERYFEGATFGFRDDGEYQHEGEVIKSKREFEDMVHFLKYLE